MGKFKKKKKTPKGRPYLIPTEYLVALSDSIHQTQPTKEIICNTLSDLYSLSFARGYGRRMSDEKFFRDKRSKRLSIEWNNVRDAIDDFIHQNK